MTEELELALAHWRTMAPQPKALVYANALEARIKGVETKDMLIDHELDNAIRRGASIARGKGMMVERVKDDETIKATAKEENVRGKRGRKTAAR